MKSWPIVKLGTLITESKVVSNYPNTQKRIRVKLNIGGIEKRPEANEKEGATKYYTRKAGQFIYGKQNLHKGAFGIIPPELDGYESSSDLPAFDVHESCYPEWIFYFFQQNNFYLKLASIAKGIGSKRIQTSQLLNLSIPLPPKKEQEQNLNKIASIQESVEMIDFQIEKQLEMISEFNKSLLNEAINGELTFEWRRKNSILETGFELLNNIQNEKLQLGRSNSKHIRKKSSSSPFILPKSWTWSKLEDINALNSKISYGVLIPDNHSPDGIPLIRVGDLEGYIKGEMPGKYIKKHIAEKYKRTELKGGEILLTVVGSTIGKLAIVHKNWKGSNIARAIARIEIHPSLLTKYIYYVLSSRYAQEYFLNNTRSAGQPTLNILSVNNILIPIPPKNEQETIVIYLEKALQHSNKLKFEFNELRANAKNILIEYLHEVFGDNNDIETNIQTASGQHSILNLLLLNHLTRNTSKQDMELEQLLKENEGRMSAISLWQMSKFEDNIDDFYEELKKLVEVKKTIKESQEKGFLELVK